MANDQFTTPATVVIAALTIASAFLVAWSTAQCLGGGLTSLKGEPQRYTVHLSTPPEGGSSDRRHTLVIAVIDGLSLRSAGAEFAGNWKRRWDNSWDHEDGTPASISFVARTAAMVIHRGRRCGLVSITRAGTELWRDACSDSHRHRFVAVQLPIRPGTRTLGFVLWLAVLAIVIWIKPWTDSRRLTLWLLAYLAILHFVVWSTLPVGIYADSLDQLDTFHINLSGSPSYFPPGYPLLVGISYLISYSHAGLVITAIQHIMMIIAIWWCFRLVAYAIGTPVAYAAALALGAAAPILALPQAVMSENVALFGMSGAVYFGWVNRERGHVRDGIIGGLLLGWSIVARIVPLFGGLPAIFLISRGVRQGWAKRFAVMSVAAGFTVAVPVVWFGSRSGTFALTESLGLHLYNRVAADQRLFDRSAPATSRFFRLLAPRNPGGMWHWQVSQELSRKGLASDEINHLMREVALEGIRFAPWRYLTGSLHQAWLEYLGNPTPMIPWISDQPYVASLETASVFNVRAAGLRWRESMGHRFAAVWPYVPWLALGGILMIPAMRERSVLLAIALVPFGYLASTGFSEFLLSRYNAAVIPFIAFLAAIPIAATVRAAGYLAAKSGSVPIPPTAEKGTLMAPSRIQFARVGPVHFQGLERELVPVREYIRGDVLNAGCGYRDISATLRNWGARRITNIDLATNLPGAVLGSLDKMPFRDQSFDTVLSNAVLEHVESIEDVLAELVRVLRPAGRMIVSIPFLQPYHESPTDFRRYTAAGMRRLGEDLGLSVLAVVPAHNIAQTLGWILWEHLNETNARLLKGVLWPVIWAATRVCWRSNLGAVRCGNTFQAVYQK